jgi:hypothetical protein
MFCRRQTNADECNAAAADMGDTSIVMDSMLKDDDNDDIAHTDKAIDHSHIVHNNQVSCNIYILYRIILLTMPQHLC